MKIERFEELLDQYGWDLKAWPESLRQDANKLIADDAHAAELLRSLRAVEDILADDPLPMGKHRAIDDIFAAIGIEEERRSSPRQTHASDPTDVFKSIDDRPKSRARHNVVASVPLGDGPSRRTYPLEKSVSPGASLVDKDAGLVHGRSKGKLGLMTRRMFSGVGMAVCILAGFAAGVTMTVQQGQQLTAQAEDVPMVDALESHFYDIDASQKGANNRLRGTRALGTQQEGEQ